jgi:hypothetical protein
MKQASPLGSGFRIYAPFTITWTWLFGKRTVSPQYKSLLIHVELLDGTSLSMRIPVISNKEFDDPIQIDFDAKTKES